MKKGNSVLHNVFTIIGIVLCAVLIPMLVINITLIVKEITSKDVPSIGGIVPQIVLTGSMSPEIQEGDLILCRTADADNVKIGDIISFYDPESKTDAIVTHRVVSKDLGADGQNVWKTKGDANNTEDETPVPYQNLVAVYHGMRIPKAGSIAMYMQSTTGLICSVLIPLIIFVGYDLIRRLLYERTNRRETEAMREELEKLRAKQTSQNELSAQ